MTQTVAQLQVLVRHNGRDDSIVLTDSPELVVTNETYRELVALLPWPEFTRRAVLTAVTVVGQENYAWAGEDFPSFVDVDNVEINSLSYDPVTTSSDVFGVGAVTAATTRYTFKTIQPPPDEWEWDLAGRRASVDQPLWYKRYLSNRHIIVAADVGDGATYWHSVNDGSTWVQSTSAALGTEVRYYQATDGTGTAAVTAADANTLSLRPTPSVAGYAIRVNGREEPAALTISTSATGFITNSADEALAHLIAANLAARDGIGDLVQLNTQKANAILRNLFNDETITTEKITG